MKSSALLRSLDEIDTYSSDYSSYFQRAGLKTADVAWLRIPAHPDRPFRLILIARSDPS